MGQKQVAGSMKDSLDTRNLIGQRVACVYFLNK